MATDGNSLVFIDVDASTPAVKVEQEESMEQDAEGVPDDTERNESNGCDSSNIAEHKKVAFSPEERELVISLVEQFPVLKDKRISSKYIMLKQRAWERITMAYNAQSFVARRNPVQIKRCWENMKSRNMITKHAPSSEPSPLKDMMRSMSETKSINSSKRKSKSPSLETTPVKKQSNKNVNNSWTIGNNKKMNLADEVDVRVKRCTINIEQDEALHKLRVDREKLLIDRERIQNERDRRSSNFEEKYHNLQLEKIKLEIELLKKKINK